MDRSLRHGPCDCTGHELLLPMRLFRYNRFRLIGSAARLCEFEAFAARRWDSTEVIGDGALAMESSCQHMPDTCATKREEICAAFACLSQNA